MQVQFLGATQTVTGSKYYIHTAKLNILVDCGLFQGLKELRLKNWDVFPIDPKKLNYVLCEEENI